LILLVLFLFLSSLVDNLFVSNETHLLWVAVLNIESKLGLEQHISSKVFGHLALVLLVKVHEGLLGTRNNLDFCDISLASTGEIDLEFLLSCTRREILDKEAEEHDRFLVLEILHQQLLVALLLLFCLTNVQLCKFLVRWSGLSIITFTALNLANEVMSGFSSIGVRETDKTESLGLAVGISHNAGILDFAELFEEVCQFLVCEVLGKVLHVEVIERLLDCLFALVLQDSQGSFLAVAFACEVILVKLKRSEN